MKKINLIILVSMVFSIESTFKVEGMMCQMNCASKVQAKASSLKGVNSCNVDFEKGLITVDYNDKETNDNEILSKLSSDMEYKFSAMTSNANTQCAKSCCGTKTQGKTSFFKRIFSWF